MWPKVEWVASAFENIGHTVRRISKERILQDLPIALKECDLVVFPHKSVGGRWPNVKDAIRDRRCPVVYWWFDLVALQPGLPLAQQALFKQYAKPNSSMFLESDIVLVKERGMIDEYRNAGVNAYWFDQGVPANFPEIVRKEAEWDLILWGQGSPWKDRVRDVQAVVDAGFKVAWATSTPDKIPQGVERLPWTHPNQLHELASRARCVLSCGFRNDVAGYWSDSFWMAVGMGACVMRRGTAGMPEGPYHVYRTPQELVHLVQWSIDNPLQAENYGRMAAKWAKEKHSLEERAKALIRLVQTARERGEFTLPKTGSGNLSVASA